MYYINSKNFIESIRKKSAIYSLKLNKIVKTNKKSTKSDHSFKIGYLKSRSDNTNCYKEKLRHR